MKKYKGCIGTLTLKRETCVNSKSNARFLGGNCMCSYGGCKVMVYTDDGFSYVLTQSELEALEEVQQPIILVHDPEGGGVFGNITKLSHEDFTQEELILMMKSINGELCEKGKSVYNKSEIVDMLEKITTDQWEFMDEADIVDKYLP